MSVDYVVKILNKRRERSLRINAEDLISIPSTICLPEFSYIIRNRSHKTNLVKNLKSVWFRRPIMPFEYDWQESNLPASTIKYIGEQWHLFLEGLRTIRNVLWINDPVKNQEAECKVRQLKYAVSVGFKIPRTCVTSDKKDLLQFYESCNGEIIAKALYAPLIEEPDKDYFIFTNPVKDINKITNQEINIAPTVFQEKLIDKIDYRLTVIEKRAFAALIKSADGRKVPLDWRTKRKGLEFVECKLPRGILQKSIDLVQQLGLVFGAIDLAEVNGNFYFLEINPNGEWGWLQEEANLPIAEALADCLTRNKD